MKVRTGYVSNSSSTSFLMYGVKAEKYTDVLEWLNEGKEVYAIDEDVGTSGEVEDFIFKMTKERYDLLLPYAKGLDSRPTFHLVLQFFNRLDYYERTITHKPLTGGMLMSYDMDYDSPSSEGIDDTRFVKWVEDHAKRY